MGQALSDPLATIGSVGAVIPLETYRRRRDAARLRTPVGRLEAAVDRLDLAVHGSGRIADRKVETELLAITGAVCIGRHADAALRAERLAMTLENRAARRGRAATRSTGP